jgi:hypothetical protein
MLILSRAWIGKGSYSMGRGSLPDVRLIEHEVHTGSTF